MTAGKREAAKELHKLAAWCDKQRAKTWPQIWETYRTVGAEARRRAKKLEGKTDA